MLSSWSVLRRPIFGRFFPILVSSSPPWKNAKQWKWIWTEALVLVFSKYFFEILFHFSKRENERETWAQNSTKMDIIIRKILCRSTSDALEFHQWKLHWHVSRMMSPVTSYQRDVWSRAITSFKAQLTSFLNILYLSFDKP